MRILPFFLLIAAGCSETTDDTAKAQDDVDGDGWTTAQGDCDDADSAVYPGAAEQWYDGFDQNCDGNDDDQDGDGVGVDTDCDDTNPDIFPGAVEVCDEADNDCDTKIDEDATGGASGWMDADADGYGDPDAPVDYCGELPVGVADNDDDCDDGDAAINPMATEVCNEVDDDCDDSVDEDTDAYTWYRDADEDGYGAFDSSTEACTQPEGYVERSDDCNDADDTINPAAAEDCAEVDRNCDGDKSAGATDTTTYYADGDDDGYGDPKEGTEACVQPPDTTVDATDCDDLHHDIHPGADEYCNEADDDCDDEIDEDAVNFDTFYEDGDGDTFGNPAITTAACAQPSGYVTNAQDCDDARADVSPDATESCDDIDDDCDGDVDEAGATGETTWYRDADGDDYGGSTSMKACDAPSGYVDNRDDCNDGSATVYPGAKETCNSGDDDCDGVVDDGATDAGTYYADVDSDGFGDPTTKLTQCTPPSGWVTNGGDCDDLSDMSYPGAYEYCDGADNNCVDGIVDESGTAALIDATGAWEDVTATLAAGAANDPIVIGDVATYDLVVDSGETLQICDGTWYLKFVMATSGHTLDVIAPHGPDATLVTSGGSEKGTSGSIVAATNTTLSFDGFTFYGGKGSSSQYGGAIIANQNTGGANPATPNITLTDCVISDNSSVYGGGVYVQNYGWVDMADTLVMDNTASSYGGGVYVQNYGKLTCAATVLGAGGLLGNTAPSGGGVYMASTTAGSLSAVGCDWGTDAGGDDNATYDVQVGSTGKYCYKDAPNLAATVSCSAGTCTANTDTTCP